MTFRTEQLLAIVQIATGLAVVASLALILFQMQQNEKLASAQLTSETLANIQQLESMVMGEDYATTIEKINDPNAKLTEADLYRYDAYTFSTQTAWRRMLLLTDLGLSDVTLESLINKQQACWFFGHDVGQAWLNSPAQIAQDELTLLLRDLSRDCSGLESYTQHMRKTLGDDRFER